MQMYMLIIVCLLSSGRVIGGMVPGQGSTVGLPDLSDSYALEVAHDLLKICSQALYLGTTADISR